MSESVTLKSYFYEVLIPSSQKNTSSPIEDILHHVSISFMKKLALYKCFNPRTHTGCDFVGTTHVPSPRSFNPRTHTGCDDMFETYHPDLILMDIKMPVMDGFEATRRIRTLSKTIPIIALTAFAFEREKEIAKQCEFTDYVVKPIDIKP